MKVFHFILKFQVTPVYGIQEDDQFYSRPDFFLRKIKHSSFIIILPVLVLLFCCFVPTKVSGKCTPFFQCFFRQLKQLCEMKQGLVVPNKRHFSTPISGKIQHVASGEDGFVSLVCRKSFSFRKRNLSATGRCGGRSRRWTGT